MKKKPKKLNFLDILKHPGLHAALKIILGVLFIYSSVPKIIDPKTFTESIANYELIPEIFLPLLTATIPWIQLFAGIFLVFDIYVQSAALIISGLLFVFIVAIASAFARGLKIDCGCFDLMGLEDKVGWVALIRDAIFMAGSGLLVFFDKNEINLYGLKKKFFG